LLVRAAGDVFGISGLFYGVGVVRSDGNAVGVVDTKISRDIADGESLNVNLGIKITPSRRKSTLRSAEKSGQNVAGGLYYNEWDWYKSGRRTMAV
jgi:hypothetical protein